jgi:hypothetical protein
MSQTTESSSVPADPETQVAVEPTTEHATESAPEAAPAAAVVESPPRSSRTTGPVADDARTRLASLAGQLRVQMDRKLLLDFLRLRVATRG